MSTNIDNIRGKAEPKGKNRVEGRQSKTAYPEKHSRQSDGGFCLQSIGALQQVFA